LNRALELCGGGGEAESSSIGGFSGGFSGAQLSTPLALDISILLSSTPRVWSCTAVAAPAGFANKLLM